MVQTLPTVLAFPSLLTFKHYHLILVSFLFSFYFHQFFLKMLIFMNFLFFNSAKHHSTLFATKGIHSSQIWEYILEVKDSLIFVLDLSGLWLANFVWFRSSCYSCLLRRESFPFVLLIKVRIIGVNLFNRGVKGRLMICIVGWLLIWRIGMMILVRMTSIKIVILWLIHRFILNHVSLIVLTLIDGFWGWKLSLYFLWGHVKFRCIMCFYFCYFLGFYSIVNITVDFH